jgi:hypothetical protein
MLGAAVLAVGCSGGSSGPEVAGASTPPVSATAKATSSGSSQAQALAYANCMRSHGVPDFPDPTVQNGSVGFNFTGSGVNQNSAAYSAARQACQSLRGGGTSNSGSANYAAELKFSACMRSHGVPGFPDPNKSGGFSGTSSMNPQSPTFQSAQTLCMQQAGLSGGSGSSS